MDLIRYRSGRIIIKSRWYALFDLGCVAVSGALWYNWPELGAWPLLIAFLPWGIRLVYRQMPFQPTRFDIMLVVFLLTAWVGVWVSYDQAMSLGRCWLILDAVLLYYALAAQPEENLWIVTGLLGLFGAMVAGYFLLTNDFLAQPAKFEGLNNIGLWLMSVRPALSTHQLHPNVAGGIIAMLTPFMVAAGIRAWRKRRDLVLLLIVELMALMVFGLLLTTSRGAWIALAGALGIWGVWALTSVITRAYHQELQKIIFIIILALGWLVGVLIVFSYPGGLIAILDSLPGPANTGTRLELMQGGFDLANDFLFTGGGLGAFPALYSQYIRVVPYFFIRHAHNLFLDVVIEQGILGAPTLAVVLLGAGWMLVRRIVAPLPPKFWGEGTEMEGGSEDTLTPQSGGERAEMDGDVEATLTAQGWGGQSSPVHQFSRGNTRGELISPRIGGRRALLTGEKQPKELLGNPGEYWDDSLLLWAALASLLVLLIHGLVEDALFGSRAVLLLLLPSGLGLGMIAGQTKGLKTSNISEDAQGSDHTKGGSSGGILAAKRMKLGIALLTVVVVGALAYRFQDPLLSHWYANLGAVAMARVDLAGWPRGAWNDGSRTESLAPAVNHFYRSLVKDPSNAIAHHRLGLVAMLERDYQAAVRHLEPAFTANPNHRGIRKNLGYSYVWLGEYQQAAVMLSEIPESESELENYAWWWGIKNQQDLAERAIHMVGLFKEP